MERQLAITISWPENKKLFFSHPDLLIPIKCNFKDQNKIIAPIIGTVFYPVPMTIGGGDLKIFPDGKTKKPDVVRAKFNRLIIFPAGEHHHQVTSVYKGVRSAIAINLWEKKPSGDLLTEG